LATTATELRLSDIYIELIVGSAGATIDSPGRSTGKVNELPIRVWERGDLTNLAVRKDRAAKTAARIVMDFFAKG
jgi:hypothetical protein